MTYVEWLFFPPIQNPQEKFFPAVTRVLARQGAKSSSSRRRVRPNTK